jgi:AAA15 family ATPase/GTPase
MIRDFWVENYLSIRDRQGLDFVSKTQDEFLSYEVSKGVFLNKLGILYGANASGKSNMLYAIQNIFGLLYRSQNDIMDRVSASPPFELTKDKPTKMHISFYAEAVRYDYDVEYFPDYIVKEELYYYPNNSKALFYERIFKEKGIQADIKFGTSLGLKVETQKTLTENTLNNHSVLSTYRKVSFKEDIQPIAKLFSWVEQHVHEINGDGNSNFIDEVKRICNDVKLRKFYRLMLRKADLNISDFQVVKSLDSISRKLRQMIMEDDELTEKAKKRMLEGDREDVLFVNQSAGGSFNIPWRLQSQGTIRYLQLLHFLYDLITGSHLYLLDELDEDLHYDLLVYFLNVFIYNSESSQLLFTSQELSLLSEDLLNEHRELVWFVEKNHETASSEYSRGDSFGLHKNLSLYNSYRIGRLGAKPELGSFFIDLD